MLISYTTTMSANNNYFLTQEEAELGSLVVSHSYSHYHDAPL